MAFQVVKLKRQQPLTKNEFNPISYQLMITRFYKLYCIFFAYVFLFSNILAEEFRPTIRHLTKNHFSACNDVKLISFDEYNDNKSLWNPTLDQCSNYQVMPNTSFFSKDIKDPPQISFGSSISALSLLNKVAVKTIAKLNRNIQTINKKLDCYYEVKKLKFTSFEDLRGEHSKSECKVILLKALENYKMHRSSYRRSTTLSDIDSLQDIDFNYTPSPLVGYPSGVERLSLEEKEEVALILEGENEGVGKSTQKKLYQKNIEERKITFVQESLELLLEEPLLLHLNEEHPSLQKFFHYHSLMRENALNEINKIKTLLKKGEVTYTTVDLNKNAKELIDLIQYKTIVENVLSEDTSYCGIANGLFNFKNRSNARGTTTLFISGLAASVVGGIFAPPILAARGIATTTGVSGAVLSLATIDLPQIYLTSKDVDFEEVLFEQGMGDYQNHQEKEMALSLAKWGILFVPLGTGIISNAASKVFKGIKAPTKMENLHINLRSTFNLKKEELIKFEEKFIREMEKRMGRKPKRKELILIDHFLKRADLNNLLASYKTPEALFNAYTSEALTTAINLVRKGKEHYRTGLELLYSIKPRADDGNQYFKFIEAASSFHYMPTFISNNIENWRDQGLNLFTLTNVFKNADKKLHQVIKKMNAINPENSLEKKAFAQSIILSRYLGDEFKKENIAVIFPDIKKYQEVLGMVADFYSSNRLALSPFVAVPLAVGTGGSEVLAIEGATLGFASLMAIDTSINWFLDGAKAFFSQGTTTRLAAALTNGPELGASQVSALAGNNVEVVTGGPAGSNFANVFLLSVAHMLSGRQAAIERNIIKEDEFFSLEARKKLFTQMSREEMEKKLGRPVSDEEALKEFNKVLGKGLVFTGSAATFQTLVLPALKSGDYTPFALWSVVNSYLFMKHFDISLKEIYKKAAYKLSSQRKDHVIKETIELNTYDIKRIISEVPKKINTKEGVRNREESLAISKNLNESLENFTELIKKGKNANLEEMSKKDKKKLAKEIDGARKKLKKKIAKDPVVFTAIKDFVHSMDNKSIKNFLESAGVDFTKTPLSKEEKKKAIVSMVAGAVGIVLASLGLDYSINTITDSMEGIEKDGVVLWGLSTASSLPEFVVAMALLRQARINESSDSIASSNAINTVLIKMGVATSFFTRPDDIKE